MSEAATSPILYYLANNTRTAIDQPVRVFFTISVTLKGRGLITSPP